MMQLSRETLSTFLERFKALKADTRPKWGKLTPTGLARHIRYAIEISLGEAVEEDRSTFISRHILSVLFLRVFTRWPGGKIKAPPTWTPEPSDDFRLEMKLMTDALKRFTEAADRDPNRTTVSPFMGPLTLTYWKRVHGVHIAHHFRQFGL
ncbi:MAG: DUF1569 domain-containing protein [Candidatus Hydrogenedentes bacterium]|nr:DUF1569 domain-containing protein [Candidatus Hydrogenedentota bacterium]